jgi:hypothetical protein
VTGVGRRLNVRLFLEGVEIPVISHAIVQQKNTAATCSIQILANDYAMDLKPRTLVHLFEYDPYKASPVSNTTGVTGAGIRIIQDEVDPEAIIIPEASVAKGARASNLEDMENQNYRSAFIGEVVGFGFNKNPRSRSITLQVMDLSIYWDSVYQYQVSGYSFGHGGIKASFTGASTKLFRDMFKGTGDIVLAMLETAPRSNPKLKGSLLGGLTNLIEMVGGIYYGKNAIRGSNDFFSVAEMRLHLSQMVASNPYSGEDELRLLKRRGFGSLFRRNLSGLGKQITIRAILLSLQKYIFHEIIPITSPRYIPPRSKTETEKVPASLRELPATMAVHTALVELKGGFQAVFDNQEVGVTSGADTLLKMAVTALQAIASIDVINMEGEAIIGGEVTAALEVAESSAREMYALAVVSTAGTKAEIPLTGPGAAKFTTKASAAIDKLTKATSATVQRLVRSRVAQGDPPARLVSQIYRPDVWMVSPPRCNVIFPEQYTSFAYGRNYMAEVSRLMLRTHSAFFGSDFLFDGYYTTPNSLKGARTDKVQAAGKTNNNPDDIDNPAFWRRDLMEHELYTGIIPKFERMSDLNLHAIRGGKIDVDGQQIPYAALAANHIFFQYRFRSRQLQLEGRYNPFVVLGFPALIIDKHSTYDYSREIDKLAARNIAGAAIEGSVGPPDEVDLDNFERAEILSDDIYDAVIKSRENTHFFGTPRSITHTAGASTGSRATTSIDMEYARTTNERTEFLGDNLAAAPKKADKRLNTNVAALEPPKVGAIGPLGGTIVEVVDITDSIQKDLTPKQAARAQTSSVSDEARARGKLTTGKKLRLYDGGELTGRRQPRDAFVEAGVEKSAASYSNPQVTAIVGSVGRSQVTDAEGGVILVTFRAFAVVETFTVRGRTVATLSPEDLVYPPWFGEGYRTKSIGGMYSYYFGTGSLTDKFDINFPAGANKFPAPSSNPGSVAEVGSVSVAGDPGALTSRTDEAVTVEDPATADEVQEAGGRHPIRSAVDKLVKAYSMIKLGGGDVDDFVKTYTWRPVASMVDILGTSDLVINDKGEVEAGYEGFHSRAFGNYDDLRTLVDQTDAGPKTILGVDVVDPADADATTIKRNQRISAALDTRKEKRLAVLRYLHAVTTQRGIL